MTLCPLVPWQQHLSFLQDSVLPPKLQICHYSPHTSLVPVRTQLYPSFPWHLQSIAKPSYRVISWPQETHHSSRVHLKQCITPQREISYMHAFNWGRKFFPSERVSVSLSPHDKGPQLSAKECGKARCWCQLPLCLSREVWRRVGTAVQQEIKSSYWSACTFNCRNKSFYLCFFFAML